MLEGVARAGIDYDDVTDTLERNGVQAFDESFRKLLDDIRASIAKLAPAGKAARRRGSAGARA